MSGDTASRTSLLLRSAPPHELRFELDGIPLRRLSHTGEVSSVFQRDLIEVVRLEQAGLPVSLPQSLVGGLLVSYADGPSDGLDASVDLSLLAASAHVAADVGPDGKNSLVVGARQSLLPIYLAAANAAGAFEGSVPEASSTEAFLRWTHRPGENQRLRSTVVLHRDRLLFDDVDEHHLSVGGALDWVSQTDDHRIDFQIAHATHHAELPSLTYADFTSRGPGLDQEHRTQLRAAIARDFPAGFSVAGGAEGAVTTRRLAGQVDDWRSMVSWAWRPLAKPVAGQQDLASLTTWGDLSLWARVSAERGPLEVRAAVRSDLLNRTRHPTLSGRFSFRARLKPRTHLRIGAALTHQEREDPLLFASELRDLVLAPEEAAHIDLGIEQGLGESGLLSFLIWHRSNKGLIVWDDSPQNPGVPSNEGTGQAWGLQTQVALVRDRLRFAAHYSLAFSQRTNPRATVHPETSAAAGDPRHQAQVVADITLGKKRNMTLSGQYAWTSGWAIARLTPVEGGDSTWTWDVVALDRDRTPGSHRMSVRWEHAFPFERWRLTGTVALAGVPDGAGPVRDCPPSPRDDASVPVCRSLDFLPPVMPWVGLRADW